jgi:hypothetical protein
MTRAPAIAFAVAAGLALALVAELVALAAFGRRGPSVELALFPFLMVFCPLWVARRLSAGR